MKRGFQNLQEEQTNFYLLKRMFPEYEPKEYSSL